MYFDTYEVINHYKSNAYCIIAPINDIEYKITLSQKAKTAKKPWKYEIRILCKIVIDTISSENDLLNWEDISTATVDNSINLEVTPDEILYDPLEHENTPNEIENIYLSRFHLSIPDKLNDSISCEISLSEIKKAKADIKTILSKIRDVIKELKNHPHDIEIYPIILKDTCLDIMKFPTEITKILNNIKITNDIINFTDESCVTKVLQDALDGIVDTYDIKLFLELLMSLAEKIQLIILDIKTIMDILDQDTAIDNDLFDNILIAGDIKYNEKNVQRLSEDDFKKIYLDLLSKNLSAIPDLLTFISNNGLPSSDAYAFTNRNPTLFFEEYYSSSNLTLSQDFQDTCYLAHAQNSLLTVKYLYELKEFCSSKEKPEENVASLITTILNIMIHFDFSHLSIEIDDTLSPTTDSGLFIQNLFNPYIDITSKSPSSDKILTSMICGHYQNKETIYDEFDINYNTEQCYHLFKITQILLNVCNKEEISLKELSKNPNEYEPSILKYKDIEKLNTADLYKTAHSTFVDLLFEGLTFCTPKFDWNERKTNYKLSTPTLLQALYLQLYTFSGKLKRCPYCNSMFEVNNRKKFYCSDDCRHNYESNKSYHLNKKTNK